jgi:O-antigen/teichoic acid export membrane protein
LIAVNRQRTLSLAFGLGVGFNVLANLALIPSYGYLGAAVVTVVSEIVLMVAFLAVARREVGSLAIVGVAWRPALAAAIMAVPVWQLSAWSVPLAIVAAFPTYGAALFAVRAISPEERNELRALLKRS